MVVPYIGNDQPTPKEGEDKLPQNDLKLLKEQVKRNKTKKPAMAHLEQAGNNNVALFSIRGI